MAVELVGGALLSSFLQVAFDRLASRDILDYFHKRRLNETLVEKLNNMLLSINTLIDDAEERQFNDQNVKAWLEKLKDAVYEAEDVLDEIDYQVSKCKLEAEIQTTVTSKRICDLIYSQIITPIDSYACWGDSIDFAFYLAQWNCRSPFAHIAMPKLKLELRGKLAHDQLQDTVFQ